MSEFIFDNKYLTPPLNYWTDDVDKPQRNHTDSSDNEV